MLDICDFGTFVDFINIKKNHIINIQQNVQIVLINVSYFFFFFFNM